MQLGVACPSCQHEIQDLAKFLGGGMQIWTCPLCHTNGRVRVSGGKVSKRFSQLGRVPEEVAALYRMLGLDAAREMRNQLQDEAKVSETPVHERT